MLTAGTISAARGCREHFGYAAGVSYDNDNGLHARFESVWSRRSVADDTNEVSVDGWRGQQLSGEHDDQERRWLFRPYAGINNIFDEHYTSNIRINAFGSRYYEPAPGRNFYAGFDVRYKSSEK